MEDLILSFNSICELKFVGNKTDLQSNTNKFVNVKLYNRSNEIYFICKRTGRVGGNGLLNVTAYINKKNAITKFKELFQEYFGYQWGSQPPDDIGNFYIVIEETHETSGNPEITSDEEDMKEIEEIRFLLDTIFDIGLDYLLKTYNFDKRKVPLGLISEKNISNAFDILNQISQLELEDDNPKLIKLCSLYFSLVPTISKSLKIFRSIDELQSQFELLTDLRYLRSLDLSNNILENYRLLNSQISIVKDPDVIRKLKSYYYTNQRHSFAAKYEIINIYQVEKNSPTSSEKWETISNKQMLWHGTKTQNVASILKSGFLINPIGIPINGKMFGNGIYFANVTSKSMQYIVPDERNTGYLFLCEVALGNSLTLVNATNITTLDPQYQSVHGIGSYTPDKDQHILDSNGTIYPVGDLVKKRDAYLYYDEYIIYDPRQIKIRYIVEIHCEK
jgi:poly [ADP-ribose] polymerase